MIKPRIAVWGKAKWLELKISVDNVFVFRNPASICLAQKSDKFSKEDNWVASQIDWVKFNVDGASAGNPGKVGIGGVLWDGRGELITKFSKQVGVCDANHAEMLAIREALPLVFKYLKKFQFKLWVESDYRNASVMDM